MNTLKNKIVVLLVLMAAVCEVYARVTSVVIVAPVNGTVTYNQRPWVLFYAYTDNNEQVNQAQVGVWDNRGWWAYLYSVSYNGCTTVPEDFWPMPANSTQMIRFRIPNALTVGVSYTIVVWAASANPASHDFYAAPMQPSITIYPPPGTNSISQGTLIRAQDFSELRTYINNVRAERGWGGYGYTYSTPASGSPIHAADINDMRAALSSPYWSATGSAPSWVDSVAPGSTKIRAIHILELRTKTAYP